MAPNTVPTTPVAAQRPSNKKIISPAYMLPNSRNECDKGLEMYSTRLNKRLNSSSNGDNQNGLTPKGEQNSSCMKPPTPLTLKLKKIISTQTESDNANVVLTSAVGTGRQACKPSRRSKNKVTTQSTGRKSIAFISNTHTNTVSAVGATKALRSPWKIPLTWSSTNSIASSTNAWRLPGTPAVALRTTHQRKPMPSTPSTAAVITASTCMVQNEP